MSEEVTYIPGDYVATASRGGLANGVIAEVFRMQNMILKGDGADVYAEVLGNLLDLAENIAVGTLSGTFTLVAGSVNVVGAGTAFLSEITLGMRILIGTTTRVLAVVDTITDDTHFTSCRPSESALAGVGGKSLPVLFAMNEFRGTLLAGNSLINDRGTLLTVGRGVLRMNGAALQGSSLTALKQPQLSILNPATGNYSNYLIEMVTPVAGFSVTNVAGGTLNMQPGAYSVWFAAARIETGGYANPEGPFTFTLAAGERPQFTFPAVDSAHGNNAWVLWSNLQSTAGTSAVQGPWFQIPTANEDDLIHADGTDVPAAGGNFILEWLDGMMTTSGQMSQDNFPPPDADYVGLIGGASSNSWLYISTEGKGNPTGSSYPIATTSPGPWVVPVKTTNPEGAPLELASATTPQEQIVGWLAAQGRVYLMCVNTLQIGFGTQTTDPTIPPINTQPYWHSGFKSHDSLIFVDGNLIGFTNHGLAKSLATGDEGSEEFGWATAIQEIIQSWKAGYVIVRLDPKNNAVCVFHLADTLNASGFWTTRVEMFGLRTMKWIGSGLLTSTTTDMIVSGAEVVNGDLVLLCGGRTAANTFVVKTYLWDQDGVASNVPWFIAWKYSDMGVQNRPKSTASFLANTRIQAGGTGGIYIVQPSNAVDVTDLVSGASGGAVGAITLPASTDVIEGKRVKAKAKNAKMLTARVGGTWNGTAARDRVDKVVVQWVVDGAER